MYNILFVLPWFIISLLTGVESNMGYVAKLFFIVVNLYIILKLIYFSGRNNPGNDPGVVQ